MFKITATYRIQLSKYFQFKDAEQQIPYLKKLGVSHLYLSPILESSEGSNHGYDVTDFAAISHERGGEEQFDHLMKAAEKLGLGVILDIVPNHMGISGNNPYWHDILSRGKESDHWMIFDLRLSDDKKISLPILGEELEKSIETGNFKLRRNEDCGYFWDISGRVIPISKKGQQILSESKLVSDEDYYTIHPENVVQILQHESYIISHWTKVFEGLSYRRFFDVSDLIGVRVDDPDVYKKTHAKLKEIIKKYPVVQGVRVDHIDGLLDPTAYLERLHSDVDLIWVEKILTGSETLVDVWPVQGTTGYEFIRKLNALFIKPENYDIIDSYWRENVQDRWPNFKSCVMEAKGQVLWDLFSSELNRLVDLSVQNGLNEDDARYFWGELTINFPRYRSYYNEGGYLSKDHEVLEDTLKNAFSHKDYKRIEAYAQLLRDPSNDLERQMVREWQQLTGPVMAKGLEDTAHYRYTPLCAMNEVGCEPGDFEGVDFWEWVNYQISVYPNSLLATSTHDTKRSEDVRARIYALAADPRNWIEVFEKCLKICAPVLEKFAIPKNVFYFLLQNIAASLPIGGFDEDNFKERIKAYLIKSAKEMKNETSWIKPEEVYEKRLLDFIQTICNDGVFVQTMHEYANELNKKSRNYSLACQTLKILGPGIPDIYQGCEDWNYALVDPDNRRPVSFNKLTKKIENASDKINQKLFITQKLLNIRRTFFTEKRTYNSLLHTKEAIVFEIINGDEKILVICQMQELESLPIIEGLYENLLTGASEDRQNIIDMLKVFPVAVLKKL
jgi:(1->4)-alpha-D-glucan 1-alpha-D-glucosylmutase